MGNEIAILLLEAKDGEKYRVEITTPLYENIGRYATSIPHAERAEKKLYIKSIGSVNSVLNHWLAYQDYRLVFY